MNDDHQRDGSLPLLGSSVDLSKLQPIHSGSRHELYRYDRIGTAALIKRNAARSTSESAAALVRHEFALLRDITLPGVVRVLGLVDTESGIALAMEDAGDENLARRIQAGPLSMTALYAPCKPSLPKLTQTVVSGCATSVLRAASKPCSRFFAGTS